VLIIVAILCTTFAILCTASVARSIGTRKADAFLATVRHAAALAVARRAAKQAAQEAAAVAGMAAHDRHMAAARAAVSETVTKAVAKARFAAPDKARERQARAEATYAFAAQRAAFSAHMQRDYGVSAEAFEAYRYEVGYSQACAEEAEEHYAALASA